MSRAHPACIPFDENAACATCGRFGAFQLEDESLCADCHQLRGACCAESGGNDLWAARANADGPPPPAGLPPRS